MISMRFLTPHHHHTKHMMWMVKSSLNQIKIRVLPRWWRCGPWRRVVVLACRLLATITSTASRLTSSRRGCRGHTECCTRVKKGHSVSSRQKYVERGGSVLPAAADGAAELSSPTIKGVKEISQFTILVGTLVASTKSCPLVIDFEDKLYAIIRHFLHRERRIL